MILRHPAELSNIAPDLHVITAAECFDPDIWLSLLQEIPHAIDSRADCRGQSTKSQPQPAWRLNIQALQFFLSHRQTNHRRIAGFDSGEVGSNRRPDFRSRKHFGRQFDKFRDIKAGGVLDDLASAKNSSAFARHHPDTEDKIANSAVTKPTRPGQSAGRSAAKRRSGFDQRWIEREQLSVRCQSISNFGQRRAGKSGEGVLTGFVLKDAAQSGTTYIGSSRQCWFSP